MRPSQTAARELGTGGRDCARSAQTCPHACRPPGLPRVPGVPVNDMLPGVRLHGVLAADWEQAALETRKPDCRLPEPPEPSAPRPAPHSHRRARAAARRVPGLPCVFTSTAPLCQGLFHPPCLGS